jgi:hypothetical protein
MMEDLNMTAVMSIMQMDQKIITGIMTGIGTVIVRIQVILWHVIAGKITTGARDVPHKEFEIIRIVARGRISGKIINFTSKYI